MPIVQKVQKTVEVPQIQYEDQGCSDLLSMVFIEVVKTRGLTGLSILLMRLLNGVYEEVPQKVSKSLVLWVRIGLYAGGVIEVLKGLKSFLFYRACLKGQFVALVIPTHDCKKGT